LLGGKDPFERNKNTQQIKQKAIVELLCDREMSGWEPKPDPSASKLLRRDETEGDDTPHENVGAALQFKSYDEDEIKGEPWKILKLQWKTKYACEDAAANVPSGRDGHWGFFTWIFIM
jgi:autophagy-related protein 27